MAIRGVEAYVKSIEGLRSEFRGRIMEAVQAIVNFEVSALEEAVDRPAGFDKWLDNFYPVQHNLGSGERFINIVTKHMGPVVREFMRRVQWPAVKTLLGDEPPAGMLDEFIEKYIRDYALRHGSSSHRQTLSVMEGAEAEGKSLRAKLEQFESPAQAARVRWREWTDNRASTTAAWETIRQSNAASREAWGKSGVTKLKWRTKGKNCPFCNKLDGTVVGIDRPFMEDGEVLTVKTKG